MSRKYKTPEEVPNSALAHRLEELSNCFNDRGKFDREFTRHIPAELDRDADLVLSLASKRLLKLSQAADRFERKTGNDFLESWG